jgi:hypothetical protein
MEGMPVFQSQSDRLGISARGHRLSGVVSCSRQPLENRTRWRAMIGQVRRGGLEARARHRIRSLG